MVGVGRAAPRDTPAGRSWGRPVGLRLVGSPGSGGVSCFRCGVVAVSLPSASPVRCQSPSWTARWWARQSRARFVQVGRAAVEPVAEMVGFAPGRGSVAPATAQPPSRTTRAARGGGDDPAGPADHQWLGGGAAKGRGEPGRRCPQLVRQARHRRRGRGRPWWSWAAEVMGGVSVRWRVTSTPVTAPSQASRRQVSGSSGQGPPVSPPSPGVAEEAVQVHGDQQLGPDPTGLGQPAGSPGCGRPARPGHRRGAGDRCECRAALVGRARGSSRRPAGSAGLRVQQPVTATMPSQVDDSHSPRR